MCLLLLIESFENKNNKPITYNKIVLKYIEGNG